MPLTIELDPKAVAAVKDPLPKPSTCRYCQSQVELRHKQVIEGEEPGDWPWIYHCDACHAWVGTFPGTDIPQGLLADQMLRKAQVELNTYLAERAQALALPLDRVQSCLARDLELDPDSFDPARLDESQMAKALTWRISTTAEEEEQPSLAFEADGSPSKLALMAGLTLVLLALLSILTPW